MTDQTDFRRVLFSKNMHPDKRNVTGTVFLSNRKWYLKETSMEMCIKY